MSAAVTANPATGAPDRQSSDRGDDRVVRLEAELAAARTRLEAAEWALAHIAGDEPLEERLHTLVSRATAEAQRIRAEARRQAELLVAEAEQLRSFARHGANEAAGHARVEVTRQAQALVHDAARLRAAAQQQASQMIRAAEAEKEVIQAQMEEIGRTAEQIYVESAQRREEVDGIIAQAREQADLILRNARSAAEARNKELSESASRRLKSAQEDADKMLQMASQTVRRRMAELEEKERQAILRIKALEHRQTAAGSRGSSDS